MQKPIKLLMSRDDFYHQRGYWIVVKALSDAGLEVVLGGIQIPREIVETAIQEDVDMIGYRIMQAAPKIVVPKLFKIMSEKGIGHIPVIVGGIIPEKDEAILRELGVKEIFHPLTPLETIVSHVKNIVTT
ncbi:MAG: cobalamin-dependent protein [Thermodesulfobacteriota bacterium]|nr:cobalamin-dependent protein [Thermodesulfobacteriota bacterium]